MAPRVVVRQAQESGAASAIDTVPGGQLVRRAWQAATPAAATSETAMSAGSFLSEHRRVTTASGEAAPPPATRHAAPAGVDVDRLIEAIEERVLAEIERRGGRYTGLF
jgi:hypothetical protein